MELNQSVETTLTTAGIFIEPGQSFAFSANDWLANEVHLDRDPWVAKAYLSLKCRAWRATPIASLPDDDDALALLSGAGDLWPAIATKVRSLFRRGGDGRLYDLMLAAEAKRIADDEAKRERRKLLARERKARQRMRDATIEPTVQSITQDAAPATDHVTRDISVTERDIIQNQEVSKRDMTTGMSFSHLPRPKKSYSLADVFSPPLQSPHIESQKMDISQREERGGAGGENKIIVEDITTASQAMHSQKPIADQPKQELVPASNHLPVVEPKAQRGHRLPDDWQPSKNLLDFAVKIGYSLKQALDESSKFVDYWHGESGPRARKIDWEAAARVWLRRGVGRSGHAVAGDANMTIQQATRELGKMMDAGYKIDILGSGGETDAYYDSLDIAI